MIESCLYCKFLIVLIYFSCISVSSIVMKLHLFVYDDFILHSIFVEFGKSKITLTPGWLTFLPSLLTVTHNLHRWLEAAHAEVNYGGPESSNALQP